MGVPRSIGENEKILRIDSIDSVRMEWSGMGWTGMGWDGIEWNEMERHGVEMEMEMEMERGMEMEKEIEWSEMK